MFRHSIFGCLGCLMQISSLSPPWSLFYQYIGPNGPPGFAGNRPPGSGYWPDAHRILASGTPISDFKVPISNFSRFWNAPWPDPGPRTPGYWAPNGRILGSGAPSLRNLGPRHPEGRFWMISEVFLVSISNYLLLNT